MRVKNGGENNACIKLLFHKKKNISIIVKMDFFSRAIGTIIEKDYDIYLIFLVKNDARPHFC